MWGIRVPPLGGALSYEIAGGGGGGPPRRGARDARPAPPRPPGGPRRRLAPPLALHLLPHLGHDALRRRQFPFDLLHLLGGHEIGRYLRRRSQPRIAVLDDGLAQARAQPLR